MKKDRRWMKSAIAASVEQSVALPWQRAARSKPQAVKPAPAARSSAAGAR